MPYWLTLDVVAFTFFLASWIGYAWIADVTRVSEHSVTATMARYRKEWMCQMVQRDQRIVDSQIQGNLLQGVTFFSSTTILVIGGLLAMLGATDKAIEVLADLPFAQAATRTEWEMKILLLILIFVYAFFKFAWSFRLFNYCSVLIGAAPPGPTLTTEIRQYAVRAAEINTMAARHFNRGMRSYFFALATLPWFIHPIGFMVATALVLYVLTGREFRTRPLIELKDVE